jgi:hypothetical protein
VAAAGLTSLAAQAMIMPVRQEWLARPRIFAYRDWQSVGVRVNPGDMLHIRAEGTWSYTPGEYHGPAGHPRYGAPGFYPLPHVPGGALIGRIGEEGEPFYVGKGVNWPVTRSGTLYLRIDDDILSDNEGWVTVEVAVSRSSTSD